MRLNQADAAEALWRGLADGHWRRLADLNRLDRDAQLGRAQAVVDGLRRIHAAEPDSRASLRDHWSSFAHRAIEQEDGAAMEAYLDVFHELFANDVHAQDAAAAMLIALRRYEDVLTQCRDCEWYCAEALRGLGRYGEALKRYPHRRNVVACLLAMGRFDDILAQFPENTREVILARVQRGYLDHDPFVKRATNRLDADVALRCARGEAEAVVEDKKTDSAAKAQALLFLDRAQDALSALDAPGSIDSPATRACTLIMLGCADLAAQLYASDPVLADTARYHRAFSAAIAGDHADAHSWFAAVDAHAPVLDDSRWHSRRLLRPFFAWLAGDVAAMDHAIADLAALGRDCHSQQTWHVAQWWNDQLDDNAFLDQPCRYNAPALLALCRGMRAETRGKPAVALDAYRSFLALPAIKRSVEGGICRDPTVAMIVRWREQVLRAAR